MKVPSNAVYFCLGDMTVLILAGLSAILAEDFCGCFMSHQTSTHYDTLVKPQPHPSRSFLIHHVSVSYKLMLRY